MAGDRAPEKSTGYTYKEQMEAARSFAAGATRAGSGGDGGSGKSPSSSIQSMNRELTRKEGPSSGRSDVAPPGGEAGSGGQSSNQYQTMKCTLTETAGPPRPPPAPAIRAPSVPGDGPGDSLSSSQTLNSTTNKNGRIRPMPLQHRPSLSSLSR